MRTRHATTHGSSARPSGLQLRNQGVLTILPIVLKAGVHLSARINYSIQAIQLTTLFPEIFWLRIVATTLTLAAFLGAAIFAWRSNDDRQLALRVNYESLLQRLTEQVDQKLSPDNRNRNAERALLLARQAYIQFLLGHAFVQTTERYLGCK